jgi:hypothetical protein
MLGRDSSLHHPVATAFTSIDSTLYYTDISDVEKADHFTKGKQCQWCIIM